jgi:hypothetical protein
MSEAVMGKPDRPTPPSQYSPSCSQVGLIAQRGRLIEMRAPNPDAPAGPWNRVWLTPDAASRLRDWLAAAVAVADGDQDPPAGSYVHGQREGASTS